MSWQYEYDPFITDFAISVDLSNKVNDWNMVKVQNFKFCPLVFGQGLRLPSLLLFLSQPIFVEDYPS